MRKNYSNSKNILPIPVITKHVKEIPILNKGEKIHISDIPEGTCKEYIIEGKHVAVCNENGSLEFYVLTPIL